MSSKEGSDNNGSDNSNNGSSPSGELVRTHYGGWVFHLGVNSIGHQFCHFRYMLIKGKFIEMYKRDPSKNPGHKPIRKGVASPLMMMEDMGLRKVNNQDLYVMRIYNRRDETKNGEFACATAAAVKGWIEAFEQAKQEAILDMGKQSGRQIFNNENDFKFSGHRPRVRRYAHGLRKLITIGGGPEMLIRKSSNAGKDSDKSSYFEDSDWDATEQHKWKCIHTVNGIRILEDVANSKTSKFVLMKSVGVVDASPDAVFDMIISTDKGKRYEWDMLTSDLELVERLDGHNDIVYGSFDPKYLSRWHSKRDFLFSRHWHRDQDGTYTILMRPAKLKPWPKKSSYQHTQLNPCAWEIRRAHGKQAKNTARSVVTQTMEIHSAGWGQWRNRYYAKFEKTIPFVLLCQVAGLREYFGANPSVYSESLTLKTQSDISGDLEDMQTNDEFYDAITAEILDEEEDSDGDESPCKEGSIKLRNVAWAIMSMTSHLSTDKDENGLLLSTPVTVIDPTHFEGSLHQSKNDSDSDCWSDPGGKGFMVRSPSYLKDYSKVSGGDPLLRLLAVDWFKSAGKVEKVATHPKCITQSEAAKKLPFILVINLEVPSKPNYSMVFYFGADRPIRKGSLLDKFVNGSDVFRDERFKLIPSIKEGYWMVKRAVGSKACLLGKAVTCKYLRQDNFLEIDVDIGSSSVASSIIGLVLGYITNLVVDLAILIEAKEESELPEYLLGTVRIDRIKLESAQKFFGN